jgi:hypothetical protein
MYNILKKLLSEQELRGLSGIVVIEDGDGYVLFNEYKITPIKNKKYLLTSFNTHLRVTFYSLRNAVIYATLDKRNRVAECSSILMFDQLLEGTEANIQLHNQLIKKTKNPDSRGLYEIKLVEDKNKKSQIQHNLNQYAKEVKKWQYRQFTEAAK